MRRTHIIKFTISLTAGFTITSSALAQSASPESSSPLKHIYKCAEISDDMARLACFDSQVASLQVKEEKKEIVAIDAAAAKKIKKEAFGFSLPSLPKLGLPKLGSGDEEGPETLTFPVKSVRKQGRSYVFTMENGQIWRQSGGRLNYIPKGELTATIKAGAIGSYLISLDNGKERVRGMKVKRVE